MQNTYFGIILRVGRAEGSIVIYSEDLAFLSQSKVTLMIAQALTVQVVFVRRC